MCGDLSPTRRLSPPCSRKRNVLSGAQPVPSAEMSPKYCFSPSCCNSQAGSPPLVCTVLGCEPSRGEGAETLQRGGGGDPAERRVRGPAEESWPEVLACGSSSACLRVLGAATHRRENHVSRSKPCCHTHPDASPRRQCAAWSGLGRLEGRHHLESGDQGSAEKPAPSVSTALSQGVFLEVPTFTVQVLTEARPTNLQADPEVPPWWLWDTGEAVQDPPPWCAL